MGWRGVQNLIAFVLLLDIFISLCSVPLFAQSREQDYVRTQIGLYSFVYCPEDSELIQPLWQSLQNGIPVVERFLDLNLRDSVQFVITPSEEEWGRVTAGSPLWANGIAYSSRGIAILKSPRFGLKYGGPLEVTALHEYVHLLIEHDARNVEIPRWLNEGLAQLLAGQQDYRDASLLSRAVASGRVMRLWTIEGMMGMNADDARLGYAQSLIAVEWLRDEFGMAGVANLVHELRGGKRFEEVFPVLFGMYFGEFETKYNQFLISTYGGSVFLDTEFWISVIFVVLVFAAGFGAYTKRKRTIAKWNESRPVSRASSDESEPPNAPYTVNFTLVRKPPQTPDTPPDDDKPYDKPLPGN
jgi:hypothetical protein